MLESCLEEARAELAVVEEEGSHGEGHARLAVEERREELERREPRVGPASAACNHADARVRGARCVPLVLHPRDHRLAPTSEGPGRSWPDLGCACAWLQARSSEGGVDRGAVVGSAGADLSACMGRSEV